MASQLILGSIKLEDGDLAVSADEAATLLPLWQAYQSLSNSDTTAEAELQALARQIQGAMQPDQVAAIAAMQLTNDDIAATLEALGPDLFRGGLGNRGGGDGATGFPAGGLPGGGPGGLPGGGPGGGPGGFGGGGQLDPAAQATAIAERMAENGDEMSTFMTRGLLNQFITTLQLKTGDVTEADLQAEQAQRNVFRWLAVAAETTGIPVETLQEALTGGSSLAEAIEAQGGDVTAVETAIRDALKNNPNLDAQAIEDQITAVLSTKTTAQ